MYIYGRIEYGNVFQSMQIAGIRRSTVFGQCDDRGRCQMALENSILGAVRGVETGNFASIVRHEVIMLHQVEDFL